MHCPHERLSANQEPGLGTEVGELAHVKFVPVVRSEPGDRANYELE